MNLSPAPSPILIIQLMHHGDVLLSTILIDALKKAYPHSEIDMLVYQGMHDLLLDQTHIRHVYTIDRNWKKQGIIQQMLLEYGLLHTIRQQHYTLVLNTSDRWHSAVLSRFSGAPMRMGFDWSKPPH